MLNFNELATKEIGISEFTDSKSRTHTVRHIVVLTETEKRELEERIAEELYRIFTSNRKVSV